MSTRLPALFIGHGSPMLAIESNDYSRAWQRLGRELPRPRAILAISAHWYTRGIGVTAMQTPRTIHDFYGFPAELYACRYDAPGDPQLAAEVSALLAPEAVHADHDWGLDHGSWSVLMHLFPSADIPVVQLSIDGRLPPAAHYALGQRLAPLRERDVLVIGSGNVVHNLRRMQRSALAAAQPWATQFGNIVRDAVLARDHAALIDYERFGAPAHHSVPTPDHYLPLLYVLGMQAADESASIPIDGIDLGSVSMLSVLLGPLPAQSTVQKQ